MASRVPSATKVTPTAGVGLGGSTSQRNLSPGALPSPPQVRNSCQLKNIMKKNAGDTTAEGAGGSSTGGEEARMNEDG